MTFNILQDKNELLVIGLVGAVGSRLKSLTNIISSILKMDFHYSVEEIHVSKDIIQTEQNYQSEFERYTKLMNLGNELRKKYSTNYLSLKIIEAISYKKKLEPENKRKAFIINSLKHEDEIKALRQVYGKNFYQISLYETPQVRKDVLVNNIGMTEEEATLLMQRDEGEENYNGQHTRDAFHLADYFIKYDNKTNEHIKNSCRRFLELIFGNPYITPTFNEYSMYMAYTSSLKSADLSRQVGAVITKDKNIIATGANDIPKFGGGQYWPEYNENNGMIYDIENGRDYKIKYDSNQNERESIINNLYNKISSEFDYVFNKNTNEHSENMKKLRDIIASSQIKDITEYGRVVHAEMDAILSCGRTNNSTTGSTIFVTTFPCHNCAKHIIASGIKEVFFIEPYPKSKALEFWSDSITLKSIDNEPNKLNFTPFVGVGPRSFLDLFSMSHGEGAPITRKKDGRIINWNSKESVLRLSSNIFSLGEIEKDVINKLKEIQ